MGTVRQDNLGLGSRWGLLERWILSSMQNTDVEVEVGEQGLPGSGEIIPKSLKSWGGRKTVFRGEDPKMRQGQRHSRGWRVEGEAGPFSRREG